MFNLAEELSKFNGKLDLPRASTPPASWYNDQEFYKFESSKVFKTQWTYLGLSQGVKNAGEYFTDELVGIPYIISRDSQNNLKGLINVCSHHGTCVAKGSGIASEFRCPYHGWTYGLKGELKKAPMAGSIGENWRGNLHLKTFPIKEWGPFLFGKFQDGESSDFPFEQDLDPRLQALCQESLHHICSRSYKIDCNWKVFVDNYLDGGYHVPIMHPKLSEGLNFKSYQSEIFNTYSLQTCQGINDQRVGKGSVYAWVHPNFMLNRYGKWLDLNWVRPLGAHQCEVVFEYFHEEKLTADQIQSDLASSDLVQQEDIEICLMVQKGLASGFYSQGPYASEFEAPMFHFHKLLAKNLGVI